MKKKLLSIIIPVFNVGNKIERLVNSIEKNDEVEIIMVDDGSDEETINCLLKFKNKKNITVIFKEHTGVGITRNIGIEKASGKYITFADADDYYSKDFLKVLIPILKEKYYDIVCFGYAYSYSKDKCINYIKNETIMLEENAGLKGYLSNKYSYTFSNSPCNKIYNAKIINENNIKYEANVIKGQDLVFNTEYFCFVKEAKCIDNILYYYDMDDYSAYVDLDRVDRLMDYAEPFQKIAKKVKFKELDDYIGLFFVKRTYGLYLFEFNNPSLKHAVKKLNIISKNKELKQITKRCNKKYFDSKTWIAYFLYNFKLYYPLTIIMIIKNKIFRKK